jgi:hypothetical protein
MASQTFFSHRRTQIYTDESGIEEPGATRRTVEPRGSGERFGETANENTHSDRFTELAMTGSTRL